MRMTALVQNYAISPRLDLSSFMQAELMFRETAAERAGKILVE